MAFGFGKKKSPFAKAGQPAPSFSLKGMNGTGSTLEEILRGGPAVLAFFKVSCPVCQLTFPFLERIAKGGKLQVFGVSQNDAGETASFAKEFGITFPMLLDEASAGYPASNAYGITSVPSLFMVDAGGTVALASEGFVKSEIAELGRSGGVEVFRQDEDVPAWKAG